MIPDAVWLALSLVTACVVWYFLSKGEVTGRSFLPLVEVFESYFDMSQPRDMGGRGVFWSDVKSSLISAGCGFALGFIYGVPVAFLMAWYRPLRYIVEPWIQFVRNIPPLAYVPLVVIALGVGRAPQIAVICLATFLTITITVYQGVTNVDNTLIKAARVLGARNDVVIFLKVIFPATMPYIITAIRLGISVALTTLIAAESTGASAGLGMRIRALSSEFYVEAMMLYIIVVGIIGIAAENVLRFFERRLTSWQEKRNA